MPRSGLGQENLYDPDVALQSELEQVKDDQTGNFVKETMNNWELWKRIGGSVNESRIFPVMAGRNSNVTYSYLRGAGNVSTYGSPIVLPVDCTLVALAASTDGAESWTAELHVGGSLVTGAILTISAAATGYSVAYGSVGTFTAGTGLQIYCNGANIRRPAVYGWFERTGSE